MSVINNIIYILHKIIDFNLSKSLLFAWLSFITISIVILFGIQFNLFNFNIYIKPMSHIIQTQKHLHHKTQKHLEEALHKITLNNDKQGTAILQFIPTANDGTISNPNYVGYVSYMQEWSEEEKKIINVLEKRLKYAKVNINYDYLTSKAMQEYAANSDARSSVILTVDEMINGIDKIRMEKMWREKTTGENGKQYHGNFDFLVEAGAWAFSVEESEISFQVILLMDKTFYDTAVSEGSKGYMPIIRKVRTELENFYKNKKISY